jgi:amino acid permease
VKVNSGFQWLKSLPLLYLSSLVSHDHQNYADTKCFNFCQLDHKDAPFVGGLQAMVGVAMIAGFSFQGTEMVGVAAGESKDPKTIPLAIKQIFWRFYCFISCVFSSLVHWSAMMIHACYKQLQW